MNILNHLNGIFSSSDSEKNEGFLGMGKFDDGFHQWQDAMKAVTRLPDGLPKESRRKMWLTLAEYHLATLKGFDWDSTAKMAFNDVVAPEDDELDYQIVKDLHRTGCSSFSGLENDHERALLKRVLLAYARWNKDVGYCQGFNVIAAVILDVMDRNEFESLKVMIFLVDGVLPKSYFTDNLRDLAVDMAVFQDLLALHLPRLHRHLDKLKKEEEEAASDERPPLTDAYTMQWFLTLFATQLPVDAVLRVWDAVLLEGSEILVRTSLALWGLLQDEVLVYIRTADDFYSRMNTILAKTVDPESGIIEVNRLMTIVYQLAPFPLPQLAELRAKHFDALGSQSTELVKWQKRLKQGHAQASQYLQSTPQKIHKSYKKVTGLVLPSVPAFKSDEPVINHLKFPGMMSPDVLKPEVGTDIEANRHVLKVSPIAEGGGVKQKSRSPPEKERPASRTEREKSHWTDNQPHHNYGENHRSQGRSRHFEDQCPYSGGKPTKSYLESPGAESVYRQTSPFPQRTKSGRAKQPTEYGVKLGLYAPQKEHKTDDHRLGLEEGRLPDVTRITRHHINACLARESQAFHGGNFPR